MNKKQTLNEAQPATMPGLANPDRYTFVDLGLPSGRLWATENAPGFYTFAEGVHGFGALLPKGSAMVDDEGNYWTRMPLSHTHARNLYFYSGGVYPLNSYYRSNGFSVRPCRELH